MHDTPAAKGDAHCWIFTEELKVVCFHICSKLSRTVEQIPLGVSIGEESFSDLDYADDVTLLVEMLEALVTGLLVLQDEAAPLGLQVNWTKTKIQHVSETSYV